MRHLSKAAILAVPLLLAFAEHASAGPIPFPCSVGFGGNNNGLRLGLFPGIHQHGPLFNYGPYYGYYPFQPYGPWDAYLRYDPFFYGDPYANDWARLYGPKPEQSNGGGNRYGRNQNLGYLRGLGLGGGLGGHGLSLPGFGLFHKNGCTSCGFLHASWLHGGWFHGHTWLHGGFGHGTLFHKHGCSSCGGVAVAGPTLPGGDVMARYSGFGTPGQSAVFYSATPTLNPTLDVVPAAGK